MVHRSTNGNTNHDQEEADSTTTAAMIRAIPTYKIARRELVKLQAWHGADSGLLSSLVHELVIFQQLHNVTNHSPGLEYIIEPLGIVQLVVPKKANGANPATNNINNKININNNSNEDQDKEIAILKQLSTSSTQPSQQQAGAEKLVRHLLLPGCVMSLDDLFSHDDSNGVRDIPHFLRLQWCKELLLAVDHLNYW